MTGKYDKILKFLSVTELKDLIREATELLDTKEELSRLALLELEKSQIDLTELLKDPDNIFIYNPNDSNRWFVDLYPSLPYEYYYAVVKRSELKNYGIQI